MQVPKLIFLSDESARFLASFDVKYLQWMRDSEIDAICHFLNQISNFEGGPEDLLAFDGEEFLMEPFFLVDMALLEQEHPLIFDEVALAIANHVPLQFPRRVRAASAHLQAFLTHETGKKYEISLEVFDEMPQYVEDLIRPFVAFSFPVFEDFDAEIMAGCPGLQVRTLVRGHVFFSLRTGDTSPVGFTRYFMKNRLEFEEIGEFISRADVLQADTAAAESFDFWTGNLSENCFISELRSKVPFRISLLNMRRDTIGEPCRTLSCSHFQPFDLNDYKRAKKCPICGESGDLYCDKWVELVINCAAEEFEQFKIREIAIDPLTFCVVDIVADRICKAELCSISE